MDPVSIVGATSGIITLVEAVAKTIASLNELHARWKGADLTIINLVSQLTSLKAALNKISEWIDSDIPQHHQLAIDLENSIICCRMLIKSMDSQILKLRWDADSNLDIASKIRVVFASKESQDFQIYLERQINALTLLLVACNWYVFGVKYEFFHPLLKVPAAKRSPSRNYYL
jgi:uncharacterized protein YaaN involved in tellurite resistance